MSLVINQPQNRVLRLLLILVALPTALLLGLLVAQYGNLIDWRTILGAVIAVFFLGSIIAGERFWLFAFYLWIFSFALGYRTLEITKVLAIHPSVVMIWLLFVFIWVNRIINRKYQLPHLSYWAWAFSLVGVVGIIRAFQNNFEFDVVFAEVLPIMSLFPIYWTFGILIDTESKWQSSIFVFTIVIFYISALGIIEYFLPNVTSPFRFFFSDTTAIITREGFLRAKFSFWGSPVAVLIITPFLPLVIAQFQWQKSPLVRVFLGATLALSLLAIYIAGYRSMWVLTVIIFLAYFIFRHRWLLLAGLVGFVFGFANLFPRAAASRLTDLVNLGFESDSSAADRLGRMNEALVRFAEEPLWGHGWSGSGWVHSDILQIAANLGIFGALFFAAWLFGILIGLIQSLRALTIPWAQELGVALVLSTSSTIFTLITNGALNLAQLLLPLILLLTMAARFKDGAFPEVAVSPCDFNGPNQQNPYEE